MFTFSPRKRLEKKILRIVNGITDNTTPAPRKLGGTGLKVVVGSDSTSWKAYREAEKLKKPKAYQVAKDLFLNEDNERRREGFYVIFKCLWKNLQNEEILLFSLDALQKEKNKTIISALRSIASARQEISDQCCIAVSYFLDSKNLKVALAASEVIARCNTKNRETEAQLLKLLKKVTGKYDIRNVVVALSKVGSENSVEPIKKKIATIGNCDQLGSCLHAIGESYGEKCCSLYIDYFKSSRNSFVKSQALRCINDHCVGYNVSQDVFKRGKSLITAKTSRSTIASEKHQSDLIICLQYLKKDDPKLFTKLLEMAQQEEANVSENERAQMAELQAKVK